MAGDDDYGWQALFLRNNTNVVAILMDLMTFPNSVNTMNPNHVKNPSSQISQRQDVRLRSSDERPESTRRRGQLRHLS